ncbi:MBOAT-domain-containing protein [Terfezia boudieri ATCC MYA-4762]|uniref:MBOAT-domain-containing protein n=1 Tax=Terfezia boudieri ATCC MYA-4762 TaxID=1051890 RepID=A0A3N4M6B6_9PEZI|nr:MBOAT-domain-containing protein [Terfezia boudieri ATCC MYA-4762]
MLAFIDKPFVALEGTIGVPKDELKLLFSMFLSYPLAGVLKRLPEAQTWKKNLFIIAVSLFICTGIFSLWTGFLTLVGTSMATYYLAANFKSPFMPWVAFAALMTHMLYLHAYRELFPRPGVVDITGAQMVLVMKLTAFAWSVHDGRQPESELTEHQKNRAVKTMPGILDYLGYVLFFPALFAGPSFDYAEYQRWITCTMFDVVVPSSKSPSGTKRKRRIPSSSGPAALKGLMAVFWFAATIKFKSWFYVEYLLGDEFLKLGFLSRVLYTYGFAFASRLKYYGAWSLSEGACILTGLGYNGVDAKTGKARWDRVTNVEPLKLEFAENARALLESWNMNTNQWLKNYVYLRITPKGKKPGFRSTMVTFATSALWHGISPGYYLTFIMGAFVQTIAKYLRRYVRPLFLSPDGITPGPYKRYYDISGIILTQVTFAYVTAPFIILDLKESFIFWTRTYYYGHIGIGFLYFYFHSPYGRGMLIKLQKERVAKFTQKKLKEAVTEEKAMEAMKGKLNKYNVSAMNVNEPGPLGLPEDVERDLIEAAKKELNEVDWKKAEGLLRGVKSMRNRKAQETEVR